MNETERRRKAVIRQISEAAKAGWRAPQWDQFDSPNSPQTIRELVADGTIKIEIYALNWRVIEILKGEFKGLRTAARPGNRNPPWKVLDANGTHQIGRLTPTAPPSKNQPSAPRVLRTDELR